MRHLHAGLWPLLVALTITPQAKAAEPGKPKPLLEAKPDGATVQVRW